MIQISEKNLSCSVKVDDLWSDVNLTIYGQKIVNGKEVLDKLAKFSKNSFNAGAQTVATFQVIGNPKRLNYAGLRFVMDTWVNDVGIKKIQIWTTNDPSQAETVQMTFEMGRNPGETCFLNHFEDLHLIP